VGAKVELQPNMRTDLNGVQKRVNSLHAHNDATYKRSLAMEGPKIISLPTSIHRATGRVTASFDQASYLLRRPGFEQKFGVSFEVYVPACKLTWLLLRVNHANATLS
jgi:hypothetical protein